MIYNVVNHGKSCGIEVDSYIDRDVAIKAAKDFLESVDPGGWEEWRGNAKFLFYAYYGESAIWVIKTHLNDETPEVKLV